MTLTELFTSIAETIRGRNQYAPEKIRAYDFPGEIENACNESEMLGWNIGMEQGLEEGIQQGKESMIDRDKVIDKTAHGNPVVITDASELPHTVKLQATHNKNLIPFPYTDMPTKELNGITWTLNSDRSVTASGMPEGGWSHYTLGTIEIEQGEIYTVTLYSEDVMENLCVQCKLEDDNGYLYNNFVDLNYKPTTIDTSLYPGAARITLLLALQYKDRAVSGSNMFVQMEKGATSTSYIPYNTPASRVKITLAENGTTYTTDENGCFECESVSPNMTFECDDVVDITIDYWKSYGMQTEYDRFWDRFQDYGNKPQYTYSFWGWYDGAYNPKYPIVCQKNWSTVDIFRGAYITDTIVDIELKGNNVADRMFLDCYELITVRKLKLDALSVLNTAFRNCTKLKHITFEGEIGCAVDFHWSPLLTVQSLRSILTALSKNSTYASGKTITFNTASKEVIEADTICSEQLALAVSAGWTIAYNS